MGSEMCIRDRKFTEQVSSQRNLLTLWPWLGSRPQATVKFARKCCKIIGILALGGCDGSVRGHFSTRRLWQDCHGHVRTRRLWQPAPLAFRPRRKRDCHGKSENFSKIRPPLKYDNVLFFFCRFAMIVIKLSPFKAGSGAQPRPIFVAQR